ncbi:hypothetical protein JTB14_015466 [Gonioctena quinquepunctata]|nr:hypothetical protein JTB14_015466 [Gonioctena quinquepunctata]
MDSLDLDNTVLNSIAFEDYDVLRKTDHSSRTPANSSKRILEKPSDIDSSALFEENNITASDFVLDPELSFKNKRSNESSPETQEKRKKIDDLCAMQLCGPKYKKIAVGPSETSKTSAKNNTFEEFDAFANYLNKVHQSEKEVPSKSINSEKGSPGLENEKTTTLFSTQFMSTQAINEIDPAMRSESTISSESHEETDEASKLPLLLSFRERLKSKESIKESSMDRKGSFI